MSRVDQRVLRWFNRRELVSRVDQRVLRWFGHMEKFDEYRMAEGC